MADYINALSKIYSFIAQEGIWKMDYDGNGEIIEAECKYFLKQNLDKLDLQNVSEANDIIAEFWKGINTNRTVKSIASLDEKEIETLERSLEKESFVLDYTDKLNPPTGLGTYAGNWKKYVVEVLKAALKEHGGVDSFDDKEAIKSFFDSILPEAKLNATASCVSDKIEDEVKKLLQTDFGMTKFPSDLQGKLDAYIDGINLSSFEGKSDDEIISAISNALDDIVTNYIASDEINGLNQFRLEQEWTTKLNEVIDQDSDALDMISTLGKEKGKLVSEFIDSELKKLKVNDSFAVQFAKKPSELLDKFKNFLQADYRKIVASSEVKSVLAGEEFEDIQKDEINIYDYALSKVQVKYFWGFPSESRTQELIEDVLRDVLGDRYDGQKVSQLISEATESGLSLKINSDVKKITEYVLNKLGISKDETVKREGVTLTQTISLKNALHNAGLSNELVEAILALDEGEYPEDYAGVISDVTERYANGEISTKRELVEALAAEIKILVDNGIFASLQEKIDIANVRDKSEEILNADNVKDVKRSSGNLIFKVGENGEIEFISTSGETVKENLKVVRDKLEETYSKELEAYLPADQDKANLWNMSLYMALSKLSPINKERDHLGEIVDNIVKTYIQLLQKASKNENAREYLKNYHNTSVVSGMTMEGLLSGIYAENSTDGKDDRVGENTRVTYADYDDGNGVTGKIRAWNSGNTKDDNAVNKALRKLLDEFISKYGKRADRPWGLDVATIIALFSQAETIAFDNVKADVNNTYGYAVSGMDQNALAKGSYVTVQAILMETMFQMENLINEKLMSGGSGNGSVNITVDATSLDYSDIGGYSENTQFVDTRENLKAGMKNRLDSKLKQQLIAKVKKQLEAAGLSYDNQAVEKAYNDAFDAAFKETCKFCIIGYAIRAKDFVDLFVAKFNENLLANDWQK